MPKVSERTVKTAEETYALIEEGATGKHIGRSTLNARSSRSHTMLKMTIESAVRLEEQDDQSKLDGAMTVGELNFVDLAGSETLTYDFGEKQRTETKNINVSLTNLKSVIEALSKVPERLYTRHSCLD